MNYIELLIKMINNMASDKDAFTNFQDAVIISKEEYEKIKKDSERLRKDSDYKRQSRLRYYYKHHDIEKERMKKYREESEEYQNVVKQRNKEYYEKNREYILEQKKLKRQKNIS